MWNVLNWFKPFATKRVKQQLHKYNITALQEIIWLEDTVTMGQTTISIKIITLENMNLEAILH